MTQAVVGPAQKASRFAYTLDLAACGFGNNAACRSAVRPEPCRQIRQYRNDSPPCALCFCRFHFDVSARKIDFAPVQALNFSVPESRERANGEHWQDISSLRCSI